MRRMLFAIALLLVACVAGAATPISITVGGTEILIAQPDGYVPMSTAAPAAFATSSAALPPPVRLAEALIAESDLKRKLLGQNAALPFMQVQVMRDAEGMVFSAQEWKTLQPTLIKQLGVLDLDAMAKGMQKGAGERMSTANGSTTEMAFGDIGKPRLYSQQGDVIRFAARYPVSVTVNGMSTQMLLDGASAVLVLKGKLLFLHAYLTVDPEVDSGAVVRKYLETAITEAKALNDASTRPADAGAETARRG